MSGANCLAVLAGLKKTTGGGGPTNTLAPAIALDSGYFGHYAGSKYTATPGTWSSGTATGEWYSNGVATGNTTLSYTQTEAGEPYGLKYRETNSAVTADSNTLTRPALVNLLTDTTTRTMPTGVTEPAYLVPYYDTIFGTTLVKVTDTAGSQILGMTPGADWGPRTRARYSRIQAWNADETFLFLDTNTGSGAYGGQIYLDGHTYKPRYIYSYPGGLIEQRWDVSNPAIMNYVTSTDFRTFNVTNGADASVRNFSGTYYDLTIGGYGGVTSLDGDIWPFLCRRGTDDHQVGVIWKRSTNTVLGEIDFGTAVDGSGDVVVDELYISPLGGYAYVYYSEPTPFVAGTISTETSSVYYPDGSLVRHRNSSAQYNSPSHFSFGIDADGTTELLLGSDRGSGANGRVQKWKLSDDTKTQINPNSFAYHTATPPILGPLAQKWVLSDFFPDSGTPYVNEAVITALDGGARARLCHLHKDALSPYYPFEVQTSHAPRSKRAIYHVAWDAASTAADTSTIVIDYRMCQFPGYG